MSKSNGTNTSTPNSHDRDSRSSSATVVRDIVKGLYEGRYVPGQRLDEPDLMTRYTVSRSTVREALKQLSADGLVVSHAFRGAQIRKLSRAEAANLFSLTEVILGLAARQAAENIATDDDRNRLSEHFEKIASHGEEDSSFEFMGHRNKYFQVLLEISKNDEIYHILRRMQVHLIRNKLTVPPSERIAGYRQITDAILHGNPDQAETATRAYVIKTAQCVLPHFSE